MGLFRSKRIFEKLGRKMQKIVPKEKTPDHSVFCQMRKKTGTKSLSKIFRDPRNQPKSQGLISEVFTFVDTTHLITKANLWGEGDKAIKEKYERLNNENIPKFF